LRDQRTLEAIHAYDGLLGFSNPAHDAALPTPIRQPSQLRRTPALAGDDLLAGQKGTEYVASQLRRTISAWLNVRNGLDSLHLEASLKDQVLNRLGVEDDARFTQTTSRWIS